MFEPFPKISRLAKDAVITEKLDGTNASIWIERLSLAEANFDHPNTVTTVCDKYTVGGRLIIKAGSRNRFILPGKRTDNMGFAGWVLENSEELSKLGEGRHYGEWWGKGIQRGYGLTEKRFSLFNTARWSDDATRPTCCGVVPVLTMGPFCTSEVDRYLRMLREQGSQAAPGFMNPEGVVVYHTASNQLFKKTIDYDGPKGVVRNQT